MNIIGLPGCRRYCSPLQALFWIIEDEKISQAGSLLGLDLTKIKDTNGYCSPRLLSLKKDSTPKKGISGSGNVDILKDILDGSWNGECRSMIGSQIHGIINNITSEEEADEYLLLTAKYSDLKLQGYIMDDYLKRKEIFDTSDWNTIENAIQRSRWKLFYTVADRLNSPELINYYINKYLFFRKTPANGVYFTFFEKRAQCTDAAYFTQFLLSRSGYKTFIRSVKWDEDPWDGLHTGAGIVLDDDSYLLVSNYTGINNISGPFPDIESLDEKISCGRQIIGSRWGAYYPPRYY
ncbi:MAG: hypothetical protein MI892_10135 [Desulfobacterales bacterium]|nr:hypothetical protein [Desulfobacterales bacterium]